TIEGDPQHLADRPGPAGMVLGLQGRAHGRCVTAPLQQRHRLIERPKRPLPMAGPGCLADLLLHGPRPSSIRRGPGGDRPLAGSPDGTDRPVPLGSAALPPASGARKPSLPTASGARKPSLPTASGARKPSLPTAATGRGP